MPDLTSVDVSAWMWLLWADAGHDEECKGWTFDSRTGELTCACGEPVFRLVLLEQVPS